MLAITFGDFVGVNQADCQVIQCAVQGLRKMRSRVGRGQVHRQASMCQLDRHGSGQGGFSNAAFAHSHQAMAIGGDVVDQL